MRWFVKRKGNVNRKHRRLDVDDWITLMIVVLAFDYIVLRLIIGKV